MCERSCFRCSRSSPASASVQRMLQVMAAYLFSPDPDDKISPPSSVALMGYGAQNGSYLGGAASRWFLREDQFRLIAGVFAGRVNYDFFGVGTSAGDNGDSVPLEE